MNVKFPHVKVQLSDEDGNVFSIIARCLRAARRGNVPIKDIDVFQTEVTSGDYDHALQTAMKYFSCE